MPEKVKGRRAYDSPLRREQADATRHAILDAARMLFTQRGYVATSIQAIAYQAGVSAATVYASFGNKRTVLASLVDVAIAGDDEPIPILQRAWVRDLREAPDPRGRIPLLARYGRRILERRAPIDAVVSAAAATDPDIAALWRQMQEQRHAGQRALLQIVLGDDGSLQSGLNLARASDVLYTIGSPETYRLLVEDRGWSAARFERWYAETLERLLLDR